MPPEAKIAYPTLVAVWAAGLRFGWGMDHNSTYRPPNSKFTYSVMFDLGLGNASTDAEIIERMTNLNPEFESSSMCLYIRIKSVLGAYHELPVLSDRIFYLEGGVDIGVQGYALFGNYYYLPVKSGIDIEPYLRLGLRF